MMRRPPYRKALGYGASSGGSTLTKRNTALRQGTRPPPRGYLQPRVFGQGEIGSPSPESTQRKQAALRGHLQSMK